MVNQPKRWVRARGRLLAAVALLITGAGAAHLAFAQNAAAPESGAGAAAYQQNCAACHGQDLTAGQFAPPLKGPDFLAYWNGASVAKLDQYIRTSMPPANAGSLDDATYAAILAHILAANNVATRGATLASVSLPKAPTADGMGSAVGAVTTRRPVPAWPAPADPLKGLRAVSEADLDDPAAQDWPAWRRSHLGQGWSPLDQIATGNVGRLRLAWTQALPAGDATTEPLVRDGVLYMFGYGDEVFAFDAATGRQLWRYKRTLPKGTRAEGKKTIALYGDKLLAGTSDLHMIALDARTGSPLWDRPVIDKPGYRSLGGPLAAKGVVMIGLTSQLPGGNVIVGFDIDSGAKLWTFHTIAQPGTPGGDSWNGLTVDQRSGGSVWTSGSFDPVTGLALWGTAQTYDTGPLRDRKPGMNNDGLYTDSTLAFEPRSGKLVWYFQHIKNDQFDLDWVFDRTVGTLEVKGRTRRVVMTAGKAGIFDALDAATGKYLTSVDMGYQNFITRIDPVTGEKFVNPDLIPDRTRARYVCPHGGGGRNWSPTAFDQRAATIFVNARDVCTDIVPTEGRGLLSTGVAMNYAPPPGGDGRYGMVEAIDMKAGKVRWKQKQRAPYTMGMLATAGGVLFTGSMDRMVTAHDQATGRVLWTQQLPGIPNASPITYSVNGKQYVAMVTGQGNPLSLGLGALTPEIQIPVTPSSGVYVFALPD